MNDHNLIPFKKGQSGNPNGRPKKTIALVNSQLEDDGYLEATKSDITSCYLRLINIPVPELTILVNDKTQPALIRIVGKAILSGKGFDIIEKMLDRGIGKAQNNVDITSGGDKMQTVIIVQDAETKSDLERL